MWKVLLVKNFVASKFNKRTFLTSVCKARLLCDKPVFVSKGSSMDISIYIPLENFVKPYEVFEDSGRSCEFLCKQF